MIVFPCHVCRTQLSAEDRHTGQLVRCPTCLTATRVPAAAAAAARQPEATAVSAGASGGAPSPPPPPPPLPGKPPQTTVRSPAAGMGSFRGGAVGGKRYGFNCPYCSSRLEATEAIAAQEGQCPTCGNNIVIPILDRYGRLIDPRTQQIIRQDPHPVHAYAAAGDRAPRILREGNGALHIACPRCGSLSGITANNCRACGMPFTMEGTTVDASGGSNGYCVAALVMGIIGLPTSCAVIPSVLAIVLGVVGLMQNSKAGPEAGGRGMAIAGIVLGAVGGVMAVVMYAK